jgi:hypothetical protein
VLKPETSWLLLLLLLPLERGYKSLAKEEATLLSRLEEKKYRINLSYSLTTIADLSTTLTVYYSSFLC